MSRVHAHPAPIPTPPRRVLVPRLRPRHRVRPSVEFGRHDHHVFHTHTVPRTAAKPAPPTTRAPRRRHRSLRARRRPPAARVSVRPSGPDGSGHAGGIAHAWQPSIRCFAPWLHRGEAKAQHVGGYEGFRAIRKRSTPKLGKPVCRFVVWLADAACYRTVEWAAFSIRLATAAGWETGTAWDAWISIVCECARLAMNFCAAAGMFLS